jgi:hypothetical protein
MTRRIRPWTRVFAWLLADRLDRQLAAGSLPESRRLLAVRAQRIVSPRQRVVLARTWQQMAEQARRSPSRLSLRLPLCRERVEAAEGDIRVMVSCLVEAGPTSARGIAMLIVLQRRGDGPLFNPRSADDLNHEIQRATEALNPIMNLQAWV